METPKPNYCCDCEWAVKKGWIFKTWYCTHPHFQVLEIDPVNCKAIREVKQRKCSGIRILHGIRIMPVEMRPDYRKICPYYKGELRHHPAIPPRLIPPPPCPPKPESGYIPVGEKPANPPEMK